MDTSSRFHSVAAWVGLAAVVGFTAPASATTTLTNGVAQTALSGTAGSQQYYEISVPAGQARLEINTYGGTGDADLYVKHGSVPTTSSWDYRPYRSGNDETVTVANPVSGTWHIMLRGWSSYAGASLKATYVGATKTMTSVTVSGPSRVNEGAYAPYVARANFSDGSYWYVTGSATWAENSAYAHMDSSIPGRLHASSVTGSQTVVVTAGYTYGGVTKNGSLSVTIVDVNASAVTLTNAVAKTGLSGSQGSQTYYTIAVPAGNTSLEVKIYGGTGDADLYVKHGARPTTSSWDYRPYQNGNNETVVVTDPAAGTWYVMLRGWSSYAAVSLKATYHTRTLTSVTVSGPSRVDPNSYGNYAATATFSDGSSRSVTDSASWAENSSYAHMDASMAGRLHTLAPSTDQTVTVTASYTCGSTTKTGTQAVTIPGGSASPQALTNAVAKTGLSGSQGSQRYYKIDVPANKSSLEIKTYSGTGDVDLYVKRGAIPTTSSWDYRPYRNANDETVMVTNPVSGTWYIMLRGWSSYAGASLKATYAPDGGAGKTLVSLAVAEGPSSVLGGTYAQYKAKATFSDASSSYVTTCTTWTEGSAYAYFDTSIQGRLHTVSVTSTRTVTVNASYTYGSVTKSATKTVTIWPDDVVTLVNQTVKSGLSGQAGSQRYYKIVVPSGQDSLQIRTYGGTGDVDLYVRRGSKPTLSSWDYRPFASGSYETVTVANPTAGTWYVMLRGYAPYEGVSLLATYAAPAKVYAILLGCDEYVYSPDLDPSCTMDSNDVRNYLVDKLGVPAANIKYLADTVQSQSDTVDASAVQSAIQTWLPTTTASSTVYFYYSGHGSEGGTLWPHDTPVTLSNLNTWFTGVQGQIVFVFDSCFAGVACNSLYQQGRRVLAACEPDETSKTCGWGICQETEFDGSVFTAFLMDEAYKSANDADGNGKTELWEAFPTARSRIINSFWWAYWGLTCQMHPQMVP